jgi:SAM-dependent methyltransferase
MSQREWQKVMQASSKRYPRANARKGIYMLQGCGMEGTPYSGMRANTLRNERPSLTSTHEGDATLERALRNSGIRQYNKNGQSARTGLSHTSVAEDRHNQTEQLFCPIDGIHTTRETDQAAMSVVQSILMRAFGRPAGVLGRLGGRVMARTNRRMAQRAVELLDVRPQDRVLEVGFGPGVGIQLLARAAASGWVAGIDLSEEMVEQAEARNAKAIAAGKVELRRGAVERLPFEHATFDKALAINSMQVWPDAVAGLREIRRVLKPGGSVALGFTRWSGQARERVAEALTAAGFTGAHVMDIDDGFCALAVNPVIEATNRPSDNGV